MKKISEVGAQPSPAELRKWREGYRHYLEAKGLTPDQAADMAAKVAVSAGDTEFHIVPRGAGADLAAHINAHVEVVGVVREKDGELLLQVRSYKLTDGYEHEWYDDDVD